ncbi:hypothetical protein DSO57_1035945 [Entomophthora muscae]|uniref:Uncharacterized protein n=1 Tax=Entomophthora muscae TaxID=34485 RepID=A0ACC2UA54_9FUNG|nr:hypothetical protein DSO57_1035945 [Entomophthora muscae]
MAIPRAAFPRIANFVAFLLVLLVNGLIFFLPLGKDLLGSNPQTPLDPQVVTLAVWVPIYGLMTLFAIYQLMPYTYNCEYIKRGISPYFVSHCLGNVGWMLTQAYIPSDSRYVELIFLYFMLLCLAMSYFSVSFIFRRDISQGHGSNDHYYLHSIFDFSWLSMYFAWIICSAFTVSFDALTSLDHGAYEDAAISFAAIGVLTLIILAVGRDALFGAVVLWVAIWLAISNRVHGQEVDYDLQWPLFTSATTIASILALATAATFVRNVLFLLMRFKQQRIIEKESA